MGKKVGILFADLNDQRLKVENLDIPIIESRWVHEEKVSHLYLDSKGIFGSKWLKSLNGNKLSDEARFFLTSLSFEGRTKSSFNLVLVDCDVLKENNCKDCNIARAKQFARKNGLFEASPRAFASLCELFIHRVDEIERPAKLILVSKPLKDIADNDIMLSIDLLSSSTLIGDERVNNENRHLHGKVYFIFSSLEDEPFK